jgi:beta-lactam-binding protein with PASTA domain/predicted Ser/Thr protein kinase
MTTPRLLSERYELGEVLGYGGMSEVHRGLDTRLSRDVAIKVLRADLARDPQFQMRFRREAQNAAALNHPAIVAVYDTGETQSEFGPLPYIVMEFVDGQTLREIVKTTGPMSQQRVIEVMADVCAALDFSHRHNIIHRDVKPANIMINRAGAVKVMDFGIARALGEGQNVTQTAAVIGTAQYLSPEQARGEPVDARSDVYAVGCVLFELLTGEPPFTGDSPVAVAYQHVREDPRAPSELNPDVSPALDAIVLKALSKNPINRYQSAAEMRSDLVRVRSGQSPLAPAVLSQDERTAMMTPGPPTAQTRRLNGGRHSPAPPVYYDDDEPPRSTGKIVGITLAVLVAVGLIGFVAYQVLSGPRAPEQVAVPSLVGATESDARNQLTAAGLRIGEVRKVESKASEIDKVVSTDPAAGTQVNNLTTVSLSVGTGPASVTVPRVIGLSLAEATTELTNAGLKIGTTTQTEGEADQIGKVVSSDPEPGTKVDGASTVNIAIGSQATTVPVPTVVGQSADDAQRTLEEAGFTVSKETVDGGGDDGSVVGTSPGAGSQAKKGSEVTLQISNGNNGKRPVPNVTGLEQKVAEQLLGAAGFTRVQTSKQAVLQPQFDGRVIGQDPAAGQGADTGDQVRLLIGEADSSGGGN